MRRFSSTPRARSIVLALAGVGALVRGLGYLSPPSTGLTTFIEGALPLYVWALVWIAAGSVAVAGIWSRGVARWGLSIIAALWFTWFVAYMWAWIGGDSSRGWLTAGSFGVLAGYSWALAYLIDTPGRRGEPWNG